MIEGISSGRILAWGDFVVGGLCPGGFCPGGICPGGFCPGGFCPGGVLSCHYINLYIIHEMFFFLPTLKNKNHFFTYICCANTTCSIINENK